MTAAGRRIHIIGGPTAGGKSGAALRLAQDIGGVIINADSMQVYDALHMLTAQPSAEDRESAPHRLYAVLPPDDKCSAARWRDMAYEEIEKTWQDGLTPIVVGGTGFYLKTLTHGLSPIPDVPDDIRAQITARQREMGNPAFHEDLAQKDPDMADKLNPQDTQRLIRAAEILEATGKSLSYWQSLPPETPPADWEFEIEIIMPARDILHERCHERFDWMIENGVLDEVAMLDEQIAAGTVQDDAAVTNALGFRALQDHLHGRLDLDNAIETAKTETRQYAKRQCTWFRNQWP